MLKFLQPKRKGELEELLTEVTGNASNNYKDAAQKAFKEFRAKYEELVVADKLNDRQKEYYRAVISSLEVELKDFHH